jgi:uncharacterized pyridoxamine 5'-phosphate oxidase family protein
MLTEAIIHFFLKQHFTIVTTIDKEGFPHSACKGIVDMTEDGRVYLLDLYAKTTLENLKRNPHINITAVDEHKFTGFTLKGEANIIDKSKVSKSMMELWDKKITDRIIHRLLKNIKGEKGHAMHPEAMLPKPEYLIEVQVKEVIDLTPHMEQT